MLPQRHFREAARAQPGPYFPTASSSSLRMCQRHHFRLGRNLRLSLPSLPPRCPPRPPAPSAHAASWEVVSSDGVNFFVSVRRPRAEEVCRRDSAAVFTDRKSWRKLAKNEGRPSLVARPVGSPQLPAELQLPAGPGGQGGPPRPRTDQAPSRHGSRSALREQAPSQRPPGLVVRAAGGGGAGHGGGRGPGAGAGPSPVTSCGAAGAGAALQRLRRRPPRLARLPLPLTPGPAAPASSAATPPLPSAVPFLFSLLPSSFPSSPPPPPPQPPQPPPPPPPRTAGRGTSSGQQPALLFIPSVPVGPTLLLKPWPHLRVAVLLMWKFSSVPARMCASVGSASVPWLWGRF
ncbi:uncharacterized protein [Canis lupus baileyi]|uniref:uncharacterized protein n=1 Tax=Canis lupus baileyi TaxID=143281 RepID=UPI003B972F4E